MSFDIRWANGLLACPACRMDWDIPRLGEDIICPACGEKFPALPYSWSIIPSKHRQNADEIWRTWEQLQANGLVSYESDPQNNLSVDERDICTHFFRFCSFRGTVLDVGCGPQPWPSYFGTPATSTFFIGIDPLVGDAEPNYPQFRALVEYLPFRDGCFDHIVMATSLDHFVDPLAALLEARRVCKPEGEIDIWVGEKDPRAPRPETSPEWYTRLQIPAGAEDVFHFKRLSIDNANELIGRAGLSLAENKTYQPTWFRKHYFARVKP